MKYIATFAYAHGRYLVEREGPNRFGGQKIATARQASYGNSPDWETGLYLDEMYCVFSESEIKTLKLAPKAVRS